jgi:hypothetical protein
MPRKMVGPSLSVVVMPGVVYVVQTTKIIADVGNFVRCRCDPHLEILRRMLDNSVKRLMAVSTIKMAD